MRAAGLAVALLLAPSAAWACAPLVIATSRSVPAHTRVSLEYQAPYGPACCTWNFPAVVPDSHSYYVTDIDFWDKALPTQTASSGVTLDGVATLGTHKPTLTYSTPRRLPAGYVLTGTFTNQAPEAQNMYVVVSGYLCQEADP